MLRPLTRLAFVSLVFASCSRPTRDETDASVDAGLRRDTGVRVDSGVGDSGATPDTGLAEDAGQIDDAGHDAGQLADTGVTPDAGQLADTGQIDDAGQTMDAGIVPDAGHAMDAGQTVDAGLIPDAGQTMDAGLVPDAGAPTCTFGPATDEVSFAPASYLPHSRLEALISCAALHPTDAAAYADGFVRDVLHDGLPSGPSGERYVIYRGDASDLAVSASVDAWPDPGMRTFTNVPGTDLHYAAVPLATGERAQYKLTRRTGNMTEWFTDPINRWVVWDGIDHHTVGDFNNELFQTGYVVDRSVLVRLFIDDRDVFVQLPKEHFTTNGFFGVLYVNDGNETLTRSGMQAIVDDTAAAGTSAPIYAVYVALPNQNVRFDEYTYDAMTARGDAYLAYLMTRVVPTVEPRLRYTAMPQNRGLAGASLGGLISFYGAWTRPNDFRLVGSQSGSLFWNNEDMLSRVQNGPVLPIRVYLDSGSPNDNYASNLAMAGALDAKGYDYRHVVEANGQHDWAYWSGRFPGLLAFLYPSTP